MKSLRILIWILALVLLVSSVSASLTTDAHGVALALDAAGSGGFSGEVIIINKQNVQICNFTKESGDLSNKAGIIPISGGGVVANGTYVGDVAVFSPCVDTTIGEEYCIIGYENDGLAADTYNKKYAAGVYNYSGTNVNWTSRCHGAAPTWVITRDTVWMDTVISVTTNIPSLIPTITLLSPANNKAFNLDNLDNLSFINVSADQNITDWTINDTRWSLFSTSANGSIAYFNNSDVASIPNGNYHINITANNSNGLGSFLFNFTIDLEVPGIVHNIDNTSIVSTGNFTAQINYTDNRQVYSYNISLNKILFDSNTGLSGTIYVYNLTVTEANLSTMGIGPGRVNISTTVCDAHTATFISDFSITKTSNRISFDDVWIESNSLVKGIGYKKLRDRYTFSFEYNTPTKEITVSVPNDCDYIEGSEFKGHFVCGSKWIDFEGDYTVSVKGHEVTIKSKTPKTKWNFNSIGELNCVSENIGYYEYYNTTVTYDSNIIEGADYSIKLIIDNPTINTTADIVHNGTVYQATKTTSTTQNNFSFTITAPKIITDQTYNHTFYINYTLNNDKFNTTVYNQTTYKIYIDNCSLNSIYTLNISFLNETGDTNSVIDFDATFFIRYNGYDSFRNYSFTEDSTSNYTFCIFPSWINSTPYYTDAQITYGIFDYYLWNYSLTNETRLLTLYTTEGTTAVTFTVIDQNDNVLEDVHIKVMKYDIGTGTYDTVEILRTDYLGIAIGNIVLNTAEYKFILELDGEIVLETTNTVITSTTRTFRVAIGEDYFANYDITRGIAHSLTFNNATKIFSFTYSDPTGGISQGCLKVVKRTINGDTVLDDTCSSSSASTITYNIGTETLDNTYIAIGYVHFDEEFTLDILSISFDDTFKKFGESGIFVSFLLGVTLPMIALWSIPASVFFFIISFIFTNLLRVFYLNWTYLIAFILLGIIVMMRLSRR